MKTPVGIIKGVDKLGRIVIPKEIRNVFKIDKEVEIVLTSEGVLLRNPKYILVDKYGSSQLSHK